MVRNLNVTPYRLGNVRAALIGNTVRSEPGSLVHSGHDGTYCKLYPLKWLKKRPQHDKSRRNGQYMKHAQGNTKCATHQLLFDKLQESKRL